MTKQPIPDTAGQIVFPELDDLEPLFSDQEEIQPEAPTRSLLDSPTRTSAPLLSNPSLTDNLTNFPLFSSQVGSSVGPDPSLGNETQQDTDREGKAQDQTRRKPRHHAVLPKSNLL